MGNYFIIAIWLPTIQNFWHLCFYVIMALSHCLRLRFHPIVFSCFLSRCFELVRKRWMKISPKNDVSHFQVFSRQWRSENLLTGYSLLQKGCG